MGNNGRENTMQLKASEAIYFILAIIAVSWFVADLVVVSTTATPAISLFSVLLSKIPNILFLGAFLILLYTLYSFPYRSAKYPPQQFSDNANEELNISGHNIQSFSQHASSSNAKTNSNTTLLENEIDFDDNDPEYSSGLDMDSEINTISQQPEEVDALTQANVYAKCGRTSKAISTLMEGFSENTCNPDAAATALLLMFENEIEDENTSKERLEFIKNQRNVFLRQLSHDRERLKHDSWRLIHMRYPEQTTLEDFDVTAAFKNQAGLNR